jgi:hypothetical protein
MTAAMKMISNTSSTSNMGVTLSSKFGPSLPLAVIIRSGFGCRQDTIVGLGEHGSSVTTCLGFDYKTMKAERRNDNFNAEAAEMSQRAAENPGEPNKKKE